MAIRYKAEGPGARRWVSDIPGARRWLGKGSSSRRWESIGAGARRWLAEGLSSSPGATFWLPAQSAIANLPATLRGFSPAMVLEGKNASADGWTATVGPDFEYVAGVGTDSYQQYTPLLEDADRAFLQGQPSGGYYRAPNDTLMQPSSSGGLYFEMLFRTPDMAATDYIALAGSYNGANNWLIFSPAGDSTTLGIGNTYSWGAIPRSTWAHIAFCAKYGTGGIRLWLNGAYTDGSPTDLPLARGNSKLQIGKGGEGYGFIGQFAIAYVAGWVDDGLLPANLADMDAIVAERFYRLTGAWPSLAKGTATPTFTRASAAFVDMCGRGDTNQLYKVTAGWPRVCCAPDDASAPVGGYRSEAASTNYVTNQYTSWVKVGGCTIAADTTAGPDGLPCFKMVLPSAGYCYANNAPPPAGTYNESFWIKRISTAGVVYVTDLANLDSGYTLDVSKLPNSWTRVYRGHPATTTLPNELDSPDVSVVGFYNTHVSTVEFYFQYIQVESGSLPSSTIATTNGATTLRAADKLTFAGGDNLGGESLGKGTFEAKALLPWATGVKRMAVMAYDASALDSVLKLQASAAGKANLTIATLAGPLADHDSTTSVDGNDAHTLKAGWKVGKTKVRVDGAPEGSPDAPGSIPGELDKIAIGYNGATNAEWLNGIVGNVKIRKGLA